MTNEQFYTQVLVKARRPGDQTLRAVLEAEFRQLLQTLEQGAFHPWFLEKTSSGLVTVAGTQTVDLPEDFLLPVEDTRVKCIDSEGAHTLLVRRFHEDIEDEYEEEDSGLPEIYDIFEGKIYLGPTPDAVYTIRLKYYQKSTAPAVDSSADVTNLWILNAEEYVTTLLAQRLNATYIRDLKRADELGARAQEIRSEMFKYNEARKHADMDYKVER